MLLLFSQVLRDEIKQNVTSMLDNTYIDLERSGSREGCGLIVEFADSLSILFAINSRHTFVPSWYQL